MCRLVLTGFMGSGKSTIGRLAAAQLLLPFHDSDSVIESWSGATIPELFADLGEPVFRAMEAATVQLLTSGPSCVIATGGGTLMNPRSADALRTGGCVVYLRAGIGALCRRLSSGEGRPMVAGAGGILARVTDLLALREPVYRSVAHIEVESGARSRKRTVKAVIDEYRRFCAGEDGQHA